MNIRSAAVCAVLVCTLATVTHAQLVENDLNAPADGLITLDTATGLEWLDLTATQGLSFNQALASNFVTVDGFRHATAAEVTTLFLNAGFLTTNNVNNVLNDPAAALLLGLMGCTQFCGTNFETGRGFAVSNPTFTVRPNYHAGPLGAGAAVTSLFSNNKDLVDVTSGHFLVRVATIATPDFTCGGFDIFEVDPGVYDAPAFIGTVIIGTNQADNLIGTNGPDLILGRGRSDQIEGGGGDDVICAGGGSDFVEGGPGADTIFGEGGKDNLHGDGGPDTISGGAGRDDVVGGPGADELCGDGGADLIIGDDGSDILRGGTGNDVLLGGPGGDTTDGGPGNDSCSAGGSGADVEVNCES